MIDTRSILEINIFFLASSYICAVIRRRGSFLALDDRKSEFFRADERYREEFASPCLPGVGSERECIVQRRYALLSSRRPAHTHTYTYRYNNVQYIRVHRRRPLRRRLVHPRGRVVISLTGEKQPPWTSSSYKQNEFSIRHFRVAPVVFAYIVPLIRDLKVIGRFLHRERWFRYILSRVFWNIYLATDIAIENFTKLN